MKNLGKRIARLEEQVRRDEDDAGDAFDPDPTAYALLVWQWPGESKEQALARWGLRRADIRAGVTVNIIERPDQFLDPPWLSHCQRSPRPVKATKGTGRTLEQVLQEALHRFETMPRDKYDAYMAKQKAERWERDQQTLRQLAEKRWCEGAAGDLPVEQS